MTNNQLTDQRIAEILARAEICDDSVLTDYADIAAAMRELQERRKADSEPVAGEARFKEERPRWTPCTAEHVSMVLANPEDWPNYEVRYLYAAPQPVPVVPDELAKAFISAIEKEQDRLSDEDYLMDSRDCIDVIREELERLNPGMLAVASQEAK
ncbi:hypothetical protein RFD13_001739 [Klebsiella aerogenes]|nr:hypothetical protein [Klebsiella aerogenes]